MKNMFLDALSVFPEELKIPLIKAGRYYSSIYEIRLIADTSLFFYTKQGIRFIRKNGDTEIVPTDSRIIPTKEQLEEITDRAIGFSGFSHERELRQGFITYAGACRMGICAKGEGEQLGKGRITSVSIRIPVGEDISFSKETDSLFYDADGGILIAGAPASGKTTLLRYIARKLSDGVFGEYKKVCVIDERGELSGGYYLGACTDVISGKEKSLAVMHAIRLLSPEYMICDEIGTLHESNALLEGLNSGVSLIASMHASNLEGLIRRKQFRVLFNENVFGKVIFLSSENPGEIISVYNSGEINDEIYRTYGTLSVT
ncbi:MAG: hypothetical protein IKL10_04480 [Clostridia bacterium]|nr:hypothetical protein [Clostridia bacterium]